ncbi:hypothetical protein [Lactobacillus sp.]|uniref:hypothetical protein n=1 Tax=Lactobacillus sp. TaxID=1591 RepID=UPI0019A623D6|nr:hypothetical protein [Lactobacillus sp.]MBD5430122.1 hypothetical protein [Lactobacillus sp.]
MNSTEKEIDRINKLRSAGFFKAEYISNAHHQALQIAYKLGYSTHKSFYISAKSPFETIEKMLGPWFVPIIRTGICATTRRTNLLCEDMIEQFEKGKADKHGDRRLSRDD